MFSTIGSTPSSETTEYFDAPLVHMTAPATPPLSSLSDAPLAAIVPPAAPAAEANITPVKSPNNQPSEAAALYHEAEIAEAGDTVNLNDLPERKNSPASIVTSHARSASLGKAFSVNRPSVFTNADGETVAGSTFINGAGTTGPNAIAEYDEGLHQRASSADAMLSEKQKAMIDRSGTKSKKKLAKIIRTEAKIEKNALGVAIKELSELQKIQSTAVKRESKAQTAYNKITSKFQKDEAEFLAARAKYEASQALLTSNTEALEIARSNAKEATASMQTKSQEVDGLRTMFDVDEKEREVKMVELTGKPSTQSRWSILRS